MQRLPHPSHYTILLKNGQLLRHQDPLSPAQFRSDVRLAHAWPEQAPPCQPRT